MADVESAESHKKGGAKKARGKKKSTKIDMTPMVDLAFLLITFFILTTTLSEPTAMDLVVPAKEEKEEESKTKVGDEQALTVLLGANDQIFYYEGLLDDPNKDVGLQSADWGSGENGIREVFIEKARELNPQYDQLPVLEQRLKTRQISEDEYKEERKEIVNYKQGVVVILKASPESTYENMVSILDELNIANVGIKAIVEITEPELAMLAEMQ